LALPSITEKGDALAVTLVTSRLGHYDGRVRKVAREALACVEALPEAEQNDDSGERAIAALTKIAEIAALLQDKDERVRRAALKTLGKIGDVARHAAEIAHLLKDSYPHVQLAAVETLGKLGDAAAPHAAATEATVKSLLQHEAWRVRLAAVETLVAPGAAAAPYAEAVEATGQALLQDKDQETRKAATEALTQVRR